MVCETSFPTVALVQSSGQLLKATTGQNIDYCKNIILLPEILFNDIHNNKPREMPFESAASQDLICKLAIPTPDVQSPIDNCMVNLFSYSYE